MIRTEVILRDTAVALLPLVGLGAVVGGWWGALGTAASGAFVLLNLFLLGRIIHRLLGYLAGSDPAGSFAVVFFLLKFPLALAAVTLLAWVFDGLLVALGLSALVFAVFFRGMLQLLKTPPDLPAGDAPVGAGSPSES
jgi:hypothetical protein